MTINWKLINGVFYKTTFYENQLKTTTQNLEIGTFDEQLQFTQTTNFQCENKSLHTWNIEIYIKLLKQHDIYFEENSDYLVVNDINEDKCGFLFDTSFDEKINEIVYYNKKQKKLFTMIDGTFIYDNRIIIITNPNFNDIYKLSYYSKKLVMSPFRLNSEKSPYHILKNYIFFTAPQLPKPTSTPIRIKGGIIKYNQRGFFKNLYEYDISSFYPNIIIKFLDENETIKVLMKPLMNDIKCLKLYLYGLFGSTSSHLYNPEIINLVTSIGRHIINQYADRAIIVATDAIFMEYPIIPNFFDLPYKTIIHENIFIINTSTYFTPTLYKGFPRNVLSSLVHELLNQLINHNSFDNPAQALSFFMDSLTTFPMYPVPLKNKETITHKIQTIDPNAVDKYTYVFAYQKILYHVCNYKATMKLEYDQFVKLYTFYLY